MKRIFSPGQMSDKYGPGDHYETSGGAASVSGNFFTGLKFYCGILAGPMRWLWAKASKGQCDDHAWVLGSSWTGDIFENIGGRIIIDGMSQINAAEGPCVFIANHMSTLETFLLPGIIRPRRPVTFVVKRSLITMPVFGPIMRSRDPVVVGRSNPREDLAAVLEGGVERLAKGISIIVFPQSTRSMNFAAGQFNTIGIKLARKAQVPVVPLALKTDAWGQGAHIKELGRIRPDLPARFKFAEPMSIEGNGKKEHADICAFIQDCLADWQKKDA